MGWKVECPDCEKRFRLHDGQNIAHCYRCGRYFNGHSNPVVAT